MSKNVTVIFGASGGVGSSCAKLLSEKGEKVILCSRNKMKLESLAKELNQPYFICDGTDEVQLKSTLDHITEAHGPITHIANCIGSFFIKPIIMTSLKEWEEILKTNLTSNFLTLKYGLEKMVPNKTGSIVLVSSCAAKIGLVHHEAIAAAKSGVEGLIRASAASFAAQGIRINGVAPGLVDTPLSSPITSNDAALKGSIHFHPMGRIGKATEIASGIVWLLSDQSSFITGEILSIDGGLAHLKTKGTP